MKKSYYFYYCLLFCLLLSNCTNDEDLDSKQITAEDEGRKGKVAKTLHLNEIRTEEEEGRKGKVAAKTGDLTETNAAKEEDEGRKGKVAAFSGN